MKSTIKRCLSVGLKRSFWSTYTLLNGELSLVISFVMKYVRRFFRSFFGKRICGGQGGQGALPLKERYTT